MITFQIARGAEVITMSIGYDNGEVLTLVDASRPETYNLHLYGETVPEEYANSLYDPVFAAADFSLDIVKMRMISRDGVSTPSGNFAVFYESGVIVRFFGSGTPEEIYTMCATGI